MTTAATPSLIAVDWGSSAFRAYLLDRQNRLLDSVASGAGVLQHCLDHADVLQQHCGHWLAATPNLPVYMSGMIGSRNGWQEVPYIPCPATLADVRQLLTRADSTRTDASRIWIVPGVSGRSPAGAPDVMRGEEVQIFGALDHLSMDSGLVCLPGTHSKWVQVEDARLISFATFMTGELYNLVKQQSSVGANIETEKDDTDSFMAGVAASDSAGGLLHQIFSIRARNVMSLLPGAAVPSYLSGLLIGSELRAAKNLYPGLGDVVIVGSDILLQRYTTALNHLGVNTRVVAADQAFLCGIGQVAPQQDHSPR